MKLQDLEIFVVANPPPRFGGQYFIFIKLTTACGIVGYGECYAASVGPIAMSAVIEDVFARYMQGNSPSQIETMFRQVYSSGFTQRPDLTVMGAFSGLEIACWDIVGKSRETPIYELLGGKISNRLRCYTYLYPNEQEDDSFYSSPSQSAACAKRMVDQGFTAVKFDPAGAYTAFGAHQPKLDDIERSVEFCKQIRAAVGNRADLLFGTHGQFTIAAAIRLARHIEPYDPLWFEEPIPPDASADMGKVARQTTIAIATGERLCTKMEFATVLRQQAASILQPALGRVGGLWEAKKVAILAEAFCAQIAPHLYAGPIEWAANIQLGASIPNLLILETIGSGNEFHQSLLSSPIVIENGYIIPPTAPGLGVELNEKVAKNHPYTGDKLHLQMQDSPYYP